MRSFWQEVDTWACNHAESRTQCACLYFADTNTELLVPQQKTEDDLVVTTPALKYLLKQDCCAFNSTFILFFLRNCRKVSCQFLKETLNQTAWASWSVKETNMWDINMTRTVCCVLVVRASLCVCVCFFANTLYVSDTRKHSGIPGPLEGSSFTR